MMIAFVLSLFFLASLIPTIVASFIYEKGRSVTKISALCALGTLVLVPVIGQSWRGTSELGGWNFSFLGFYTPMAIGYFFFINRWARKYCS